MRIVHIAPPWLSIPPRNYGGTEAVIAYLVEEQIAQGHEVTLIASGDSHTSGQLVSWYPKALLAQGFPWSTDPLAYYHYFKAIEYIQSQTFDIVHLHLSSSGDMYMYPLAERLTTPHLITLHSHFPFDRFEKWIGDADEYYLPWLEKIPLVTISKSACGDLPSGLKGIAVVHHGLPLDQFMCTDKKKRKRKREDFLLWLGRIVPDKGTHLAIEVARQAGLPLILAGTIDRHVPEAVRYFEEKIQPYIDNEQVRFVGSVNLRQKRSLFSRAHCFINPIQWEEPFGMVMIESMAMGCPVISFARGAAPEIIAEGQSGFLVNSVSEMVTAIQKLDRLNENTVCEYAREHFSVPIMARHYQGVYEQIITQYLETNTQKSKAQGQ